MNINQYQIAIQGKSQRYYYLYLKGVYNMPEMLNVSHKRRAIRAAKELHYGKKVVDKLKKATSDNEITRIMYSARNAEWSEKSGE